MATTADNVTKFTTKQLKRVSRMGFDWNMVLIIIFLLGFGLIMVYSASSYRAARDYGGNATYFLSRQAIADLLGLAAAVFAMFIPIKFFQKGMIPWIVYAIAFVLCGDFKSGYDRFYGCLAYGSQKQH